MISSTRAADRSDFIASMGRLSPFVDPRAEHRREVKIETTQQGNAKRIK